MKPVDRYRRSYRRFTWHNKKAYDRPVLSATRRTPKDSPADQCSYYSVIAALEANMRLNRGILDCLSRKYLKHKHEKVVKANANKTMVGRKAIADKTMVGRNEQLMRILIEIGVPSEHIYNLNLQGQHLPCPMRKIAGYKKYLVSRCNDIRRALNTHLRKGPMIAVFWVSKNYMGCMKHGSIYRFTGLHTHDAKHKNISYSVCVVGFGIEETVPFLMFRTENLGKGWLEYGRVEIQSVKELYGIDV